MEFISRGFNEYDGYPEKTDLTINLIIYYWKNN